MRKLTTITLFFACIFMLLPVVDDAEAGGLGKEPPTRGVGLRAHEPWLLNRDERGRNLGDSALPTMTFRPRLFVTTAVVLLSSLR